MGDLVELIVGVLWLSLLLLLLDSCTVREGGDRCVGLRGGGE